MPAWDKEGPRAGLLVWPWPRQQKSAVADGLAWRWPRWKLDADLYGCSRSLDALNLMISAISSLLFRFRHDFPKLAPKKQQASGHHWHPNFALQHPREARLIGVGGGGSLEIWSCIAGGLDRRSMPIVATSSVAAAIFACVVLPGVRGTIANVIEYRPSSFAVGIKDSVLEPGTRK